MSFNFPVLSDEEMQNLTLAEEGIYDFQVNKASEEVSKAGNNQIKLTLKIWDKQGKERIIYDYLVGTTNWAFKIKHFCKSIGLDYNCGSFEPWQCEGKSGKCEIVIKSGDKKPDGTFYHSKNAVKDYVTFEENVKKVEMTPDLEDFKDDRIPF